MVGEVYGFNGVIKGKRCSINNELIIGRLFGENITITGGTNSPTNQLWEMEYSAQNGPSLRCSNIKQLSQEAAVGLTLLLG